jgi:hypothetical protein
MGCPYCESEGDCEHHLLSVDLGEREACGGALYHLFNERWQRCEAEGYEKDDDFEPSTRFHECVEEVAQITAEIASKVDIEFEVAGGLASGAFQDFFCPAAGEVERVVDVYAARFTP